MSNQEEVVIMNVAATPYRYSTERAELFEALAAAQAEIEGALKDSTNPHFKAKYADLGSIWEACRGPLTKNGLCVIQIPSANGPSVTVTTTIGHKSGQWCEGDLTITAMQNTAQAIGSAITYGRRYALSAMAGIAPEDDDGHDATAHTYQPQEYNRIRSEKIAQAEAYQAQQRQESKKPAVIPEPVEILPAASENVGAVWVAMGSKISTVVKAFAELKQSINELTGSEAPYYDILSMHGMKHANDVKTVGLQKTRQAAKELVEYIEKCAANQEPPAAEGYQATDEDVPAIIGSQQ